MLRWRTAIERVRTAYMLYHQRQPDLFRPRRYTEKIQWRKLFDLNPLYPVFCDKLAARDFIASRIGMAHHIPLLWSGRPDDIPFDELRPPYVIKSNHACAQVIMIHGETDIDRTAIRETATSWLAAGYGVEQEEPGYVPVPRRIVIERMLTAPTGGVPAEYRFFIFDGKLAAIQTVVIEDKRMRHGAFFEPDWTRLDWHFTRCLDTAFARPERLDEMIRVAERLGRGFDHLRVDFYDGGSVFWLGELTVYPWSGHAAFNPDEADFLLGAYWRLRAPAWRAAVTLLLSQRNIQLKWNSGV